MPIRPSGKPNVIPMFSSMCRELNFGSDLDLVFVYSDDGSTDGAEPSGNLQFFVDLAQQMLNMLERSTPPLYPVDARLRPEGGSAMLALS